MTSVRKLKVIMGGGDPDSVLARRIDVVSAAMKWYAARKKESYTEMYVTEDQLETAVRRYRAALKKRGEILS